MRNPEIVLESLKSHSRTPGYHYERLYRNLYNRAFYLLAYQQTYPKPGNMSPGVDGKTIDGMSYKRIENIISSIKDHSYQPKPARRTYIPKKNGKLRPLGVPASNDKLVQQVIKMLLESIYEDVFSDNSHGFRPGRSCLTALSQIKLNFTGVKWFIEGDISSYFDTVDHQILISILRKRIKDEYFISLIWKFLRAGFEENGQLHKPYKGLHQGSLVSPILANIYLDELDSYIEVFKKTFDSGQKRKLTREYIGFQTKEQRLRKTIRATSKKSPQREEMLKNLKVLRSMRRSILCSDPMDSSYKRITYQRYADDFLIGVIGSEQDAKEVKQNIQVFLRNRLHLELSEEKTLITHGKGKANFLGYDITVGRKGTPSRDKSGKVIDRHHGRIKLYIPQQAWLKKLTQSGAIRISHGPDKPETWEPVARKNIMYLPDHEILCIYNREIRGLYQYYKIADNASVLNDYYYFMKYSLTKTLAGKHKSTTRKIMRKHYVEGRFQVRYPWKESIKTTFLYDYGFKKQPIIIRRATNKNPTELLKRLSQGQCELCEVTGVEVSVHHVRKLSELYGVTEWEKKMLDLNRKTLMLCNNCHTRIHWGF